MEIQKIVRRSYNCSFLNSVQLVIAFPNNERKAIPMSSVIKLLEDEGFRLTSAINPDIIRAERGSSNLIIASGTILLTVGARDYMSFENYSRYVTFIKELLHTLHVEEIITLLFQKRNSYPFTKKEFKEVPTKEELYDSIFSSDFLKEESSLMLSEQDDKAYMVQRKYSETDVFYLVESIISAIEMKAMPVENMSEVLAGLNDEMFSIWNTVTSNDVKKIMEGK